MERQRRSQYWCDLPRASFQPRNSWGNPMLGLCTRCELGEMNRFGLTCKSSCQRCSTSPRSSKFVLMSYSPVSSELPFPCSNSRCRILGCVAKCWHKFFRTWYKQHWWEFRCAISPLAWNGYTMIYWFGLILIFDVRLRALRACLSKRHLRKLTDPEFFWLESLPAAKALRMYTANTANQATTLIIIRSVRGMLKCTWYYCLRNPSLVHCLQCVCPFHPPRALSKELSLRVQIVDAKRLLL